MSALYQLRKEVKALLLQGGLWNDEEVIIKRRGDLWNNVAVATAASAAGQCLVVGIAKGSPSGKQNPQSKQLLMEVTIPVTLMELPTVDPDEPADDAATDEDSRWEETVMRLLGDPLGRSEVHYELLFDGFEEVQDDQYVSG
ncbi:MAG: hypothetical protein Q8Q59_15790 [Luteolibacter sp.]|nr:hypothetical protein [Luteolibacter sp.]